MKEQQDIPLLDYPVDYLIGDASGRIMNEYGRFPCKLKCGTYAYLVRGSAIATLNITRYEFVAGDLILVEPGAFLQIEQFSDDALVYYCGFSSSFLEKSAYSMNMTTGVLRLTEPRVHLKADVGETFESVMQSLMKASNCEPSILNVNIMVQVFHLIQQFILDQTQQHDIPARPQNRKMEIYQAYTDLVLANYATQHQVSFYAEKMGMTLPHLCTTIKEVTGNTAASIITDAILTSAKSQLKITNHPIKEIAMSLGFDNVTFFNKYFKTHVGVSPKVYRNS